MPDDETTLRYCHAAAAGSQSSELLSIIDEFKHDLDELTTVQMAQSSSPPSAVDMDQETVTASSANSITNTTIITTATTTTTTTDLELQNEQLVMQVEYLTKTLHDRDTHITHLHSMINGYSDFSENRRLNDEMHELKRLNCDQSRKVRELASLLKSQEDERIDLCNKYEQLTMSFQGQCKELRRAGRSAVALQERLSQLEQQLEELRRERSLLREEVIALKEKDACMTGRERSLCEQLKCSQLEVDKSRRLLNEMQAFVCKEKSHHGETVQLLEMANEEIRRQLHNISCECKEMQMKLKQQTDINAQQQQIIESFRKWRDAQVRSDDATNEVVRRADQHIALLLGEKQRIYDEYEKLHHDYCVLETEMQRIKKCINSRYSSSSIVLPDDDGVLSQVDKSRQRHQERRSAGIE